MQSSACASTCICIDDVLALSLFTSVSQHVPTSACESVCMPVCVCVCAAVPGVRY